MRNTFYYDEKQKEQFEQKIKSSVGLGQNENGVQQYAFLAPILNNDTFKDVYDLDDYEGSSK